MLDYATALSNIYGWYSYAQYVHIWNLYNEKKITDDIAEVFLEQKERRDPVFWLRDNTVIPIPSNAFEILEEHNYKFKNDPTANRFLEMYLDFMNNTRKWPLKDFTPIEVNKLF